MRSLLRHALAALLICPCASAAPQLKPPRVEKSSIIGEWIPIEPGQKYEFTEDGRILADGVIAPTKPRFFVNSKKIPAEFDVTHSGHDGVWLGIYKVEGDTLTVCMNLKAGGLRPTVFEKSGEPPIWFQTFTRKKPRN